jgi:lipopolysaccharide transport system permease protein
VSTYDSAERPVLLQSLVDLWADRHVVMALTSRLLLARHRQTVLGLVWSIMQATSAGVLAALLLGRFVRVPETAGASYVVFVLGGMTGWMFFVRTVGAGVGSILEEGALLARVHFARAALPLSRVAAGIVDLALALVVFVVVAVATGTAPALAWLALPLPLATLILFTAACTMAPAAAFVRWRDVNHAVGLSLQAGFFAVPVLYPLAVFPDGLRQVWAVANPLVEGVEELRAIILDGRIAHPGLAVAALGWAALTALASFAIVRWLEPTLPDRL